MKNKDCQNCGEELETLGNDQYYCKECDETFVYTKGKTTIPKEKQSLKDVIKQQGKRIQSLEKDVQGKEGEDFWPE